MDPYAALRPLLFHLDPEAAHHLMISALQHGAFLAPLLRAWYGADADHPALRQSLWGLEFANPVGVAAGLDKDGVAIDALAACGFSHVEIGTVTGQAQPGNPRPRLFRLPVDGALINRMGFNNQGAEAVAARLAAVYAQRPRPRRLGINLGKSKVVPVERAVEDYASSVATLARHADYLVVNVSSPNTPGLRDLQAEAALRPLLNGVRVALACAVEGGRKVPLLVKIAPDLDAAGIDAAVEVALECGCDGLIATNTTISRDGLATNPLRVARYGAGGLSGSPLRARAEEVLSRVARRVARRVPIIGVGGIDSAASAWARIGLGASLVQIYSALIYRGPGVVGEINRGLVGLLTRTGLRSLDQAVGRDL